MSYSTIPKILIIIGGILFFVFILASFNQNIDTSFFVSLLYNDANEFAQTGTITSNFMPIGYSGFLGLCIANGGTNLIPVCQSLIYFSILLCALIFLIFRGVKSQKLLFGILITAIHPVLFLNIWRIHDGNATVLLLLGLLVACLFAERKRNFTSTLILGVVTGLLLTVRINTILLVLPVLLIVYFPKIFEYIISLINKTFHKAYSQSMNENIILDSKNYYFQAISFMVVTILVFAVVNISIKQKPFYFPGHGFYNLFAGSNEFSSRYLLSDFSGENSLKEALSARGYTGIDKFEERLIFPSYTYKELAVEFIKEHPIEYIKLAGIKIFTLFRPGYHMVPDFSWISPEGLKRMTKILLAFPFFIWFYFILRTRANFLDKDNLLIFLVVFLYILPFILANADPRYRFPLDIIMILDCFSRYRKLS